MVASLIWIGFKELFIERFMPEYQELYEGVNLEQIRHVDLSRLIFTISMPK